ncbi:MAG: sensor histidine kinase [Desulfosudis oleivorans]|nr:sensor histidine kinase [Desulfosudis oleivorans]
MCRSSLSLLSLQSSSIRDAAVAEAFRESRNRIRSLAMIHEKLYRLRGHRADRYVAEYMRDLVSYLVSSYNMRNDPAETHPVRRRHPFRDRYGHPPRSHPERARLERALKHAFTTEQGGKYGIRIILFPPPGRDTELVVGDNGAGLPARSELQKDRLPGTSARDDPVRQLDGRISLRRRGGRLSTPIDFAESTDP